MKIYVVINVGRFPPGPSIVNVEDPIVVKVEMASFDKSKVEEYLKSLPNTIVEKVSTDVGDVDCMCHRGIYEVDIELPASLLENSIEQEIDKLRNLNK